MMFNFILAALAALIVGLPIIWMKSNATKTIGSLVALGVGAMVFGLSNIYVYPEYRAWQFEYEIKKQPLFGLISQNYPAEFQAYLQQVKSSLETDEDPSKIAQYTSEMVNNIFYKSLAHAPDEYVSLYLKSTIDLYHYLNSQDPKAVLKLENGDTANDYDLNKLYENKDFQNRLSHLLDSKRFVIESSIKTPVTPPTATVADPLLKGVMVGLDEKYGEKVVKEVFTHSKEVAANVGAQVIIEFYVNILGSGKENAGQIMRFIANLKDEPQQKEEKTAKNN